MRVEPLATHAEHRPLESLGRYLVVALFVLHGLIHAMGFAAVWQLGQFNAVSNIPTLPPHLTAASPLVAGLGILWLAAALIFLAAAAGLAMSSPWWRTAAAVAALLSLLLCIMWWNDAPFGAVVDIAILVGLTISTWLIRATRPKGA
ncbi:MAG TPA: hypothetical protein VLJ14_04005 [Ktedonobacterales bacterium]|jgi:hypothetical protein|nr:hypothetical protein [Ktedonobacterales bacterium]